MKKYFIILFSFSILFTINCTKEKVIQEPCFNQIGNWEGVIIKENFQDSVFISREEYPISILLESNSQGKINWFDSEENILAWDIEYGDLVDRISFNVERSNPTDKSSFLYYINKNSYNYQEWENESSVFSGPFEGSRTISTIKLNRQ